MLTVEEWHQRYRQQVIWTQSIRAYLFAKFSLKPEATLLEVGCGTGAVLENLPGISKKQMTGLDLKLDHLTRAVRGNPAADFVCGDALSLPFPSNRFDLTCCHFFLLWVQNPAIALTEMARVTRPGGIVAALAEPDYGARIDYPAPLAELGHLQGLALQRQGADVLIGRRLAGLFNEIGLQQVQVGLIGGEWGRSLDNDAWETEWAVLEADLAGMIPQDELVTLRRIDAAAWQKGERILFVPTFYAYGTIP
ncbi:MAG: methyltransferase domain-containing protein [Anaerolineae bacterium]|nr:methyltransferase domain-containing protein [Anaerolineae bacterium]